MAAGEKKKKEYPQVTGQWRHHGITTAELIYNSKKIAMKPNYAWSWQSSLSHR
jgi:hypothetical protein